MMVQTRDVDQKKFVCSEKHCGKAFPTALKLNHHKRRIHNADRKFTCDVCPSSFYTQEKLEKHTQIHKVQRNYKCTDPGCSKAFTLEKDLKRHARSHTGERPFICMVCGYRQSRKDNLRRHLKTVHRLTIKKFNENAYLGCDNGFANTSKDINEQKLVEKKRAALLSRIKVERDGPSSSTRSVSDAKAKQFKKKRMIYVDQGNIIKYYAEFNTPSNKPYSCNRCSDRFATSEEVKHHRNTVHYLGVQDNSEITVSVQSSSTKLRCDNDMENILPEYDQMINTLEEKQDTEPMCSNSVHHVNVMNFISSLYPEEKCFEESKTQFPGQEMDTHEEIISNEPETQLYTTNVTEEKSERKNISRNDGAAVLLEDIKMSPVLNENLSVQSGIKSVGELEDVSKIGKFKNCATDMPGKEVGKCCTDPIDTDQTLTYILPHNAPFEDSMSDQNKENDNPSTSQNSLVKSNRISSSYKQGAFNMYLINPNPKKAKNNKNTNCPTLYCSPSKYSVDGEQFDDLKMITSDDVNQNQMTQQLPYGFKADGKELFLTANIILSCVFNGNDNEDNDTSWIRLSYNTLEKLRKILNLNGDMSQLSKGFSIHVSSSEEKHGKMIHKIVGNIRTKIVGNREQLEMICLKIGIFVKSCTPVKKSGLDCS